MAANLQRAASGNWYKERNRKLWRQRGQSSLLLRPEDEVGGRYRKGLLAVNNHTLTCSVWKVKAEAKAGPSLWLLWRVCL